MQPDLRQMNIDRFRKLLDRTSDSAEQARIRWLIAEERAKPASAYPHLGPSPQRTTWRDAPPMDGKSRRDSDA